MPKHLQLIFQFFNNFANYTVNCLVDFQEYTNKYSIACVLKQRKNYKRVQLQLFLKELYKIINIKLHYITLL